MIGVNKVVEYKNSYDECLMVMDRSDPRKVILEMDRVVLTIKFSDAKKSYQLRK